MEHPWFQRLRRINQLGLTHLVYPGAIHTRFHHALGCMHLMGKALKTLEQKGVEISDAEKEATSIAILLHDIGHGPFSHVLENTILPNVHHETLSIQIMEALNNHFKGRLSLAIEIFKDKHPKKFLHQLISSQLDMDRLDYLTRDSFYTGVNEGIVGIDRIISMLAVTDNQLVVEEKGIYSIEKFIIARRLMYWQVYLHKTTISADQVLTNIVRRAKEIILQGKELEVHGELRYFLDLSEVSDFDTNLLERFNKLDDSDLTFNIKNWQYCKDPVLSKLCSAITNRRLPKIRIKNSRFTGEEIEHQKKEYLSKYPETGFENIQYFVSNGEVKNEAYTTTGTINVLTKDGELLELSQASDNYNITALTEKVTKYYLSVFN
ncbi:MAG: HD domain-containing protein [Flavobacteriales bacterium]|nr:HD domain-containing protein [Flavobacteriales bacterium]